MKERSHQDQWWCAFLRWSAHWNDRSVDRGSDVKILIFFFFSSVALASFKICSQAEILVPVFHILEVPCYRLNKSTCALYFFCLISNLRFGSGNQSGGLFNFGIPLAIVNYRKQVALGYFLVFTRINMWIVPATRLPTLMRSFNSRSPTE